MGFVLFCLVAVVSMCFLPVIVYTVGESSMGPAPVFIFEQLAPREASPRVCIPHSLI